MRVCREFKGYENPIRVLCGLGVCGFGYDRLRMLVASFLTSQSNQNKRERERERWECHPVREIFGHEGALGD